METKGQIVAVVSDANEKGEASMPTTSKVRNTIGVGASSGGKVSAGAVNVKFENINVHGALYVQGSHTDHGVGGKTTPQEYVTATVKDYESFESRDKNMTEVMEALKDPNISVIGVHGMPGVGKTMLVREIMERARAERLFPEMVMVTVTQYPDHRNIQSQIADRLGLEFTEGSLEGRADKLHDRLYGKEILLALDDIWDELDLEKVRIPSTGHPSRLKVLMTSRYGHVLSKMNADEIIAIELLTDDESWRFFTKIVGEAMTKAPYMELIGRDVVKECARLPIALAIVAKTLKNKEEAIWKVSLDVLRNPAEDELQEVNKKVYHPTKLSYGILQKEAQDLFLLCCVFPEDYDIHIEELFVW